MWRQKWRMADNLKEQWPRHCFIKIVNEKTQPALVPMVDDFRFIPSELEDYKRTLMENSPCSLPSADAFKKREKRRKRLLEAAKKWASKAQQYPDKKGFRE